MRFVPALAALLPGEFAFDGDPHARQRPMGPVLEGLRQLGVQVDCEQGENALPFVLRSPVWRTQRVSLRRPWFVLMLRRHPSSFRRCC